MNNLFVGRMGEDAVAAWYMSHGYAVIGRNVRESHNEIDLIVEDGESIVFVEVKTRTACKGQSSRYGRPAAAVDHGKRQRTVQAAQTYLRAHPTVKQPRIDVAEVYLRQTGDSQIEATDILVFRNAFGAR